MKRLSLFLFTACATSAFAVQAIPSLDAPPASTYPSSYPATYPSTANVSGQLLDTISKLQSDVAQLKNKLADQTAIINDLRVRESNVEKTLALSPGSTYNPQVSSSYIPASNLALGLTNTDNHTALPGEKGRYDYAYGLFRNGAYDQAIAEFQSLINTYPNGSYADNAQYWTGEALLKKGDKQGAMRAFDRVVYAYPRGGKVPDALLKLGITQAAVGNKAKAKEYYDYLIAAYPGTPAATTAYSKRATLPIY